jgi:hypothetical protein
MDSYQATRILPILHGTIKTKDSATTFSRMRETKKKKKWTSIRTSNGKDEKLQRQMQKPRQDDTATSPSPTH